MEQVNDRDSRRRGNHHHHQANRRWPLQRDHQTSGKQKDVEGDRQVAGLEQICAEDEAPHFKN